MHILCRTEGLRGQILRDAGKLSRIDMGVDRFVVSYLGYEDLIISSLSRYNFSQFLANRA